MNSENTYSLKDILLYSPYEIEKQQWFSENEFENSFLIDCESMYDAEKKLNSYCDNLNDLSKNWIILHGFSGNGKTTFIKWYGKRNKESIKTIYLDCSQSAVPSPERDSQQLKDFQPIKSAIINYLNIHANAKAIFRFIYQNKYFENGLGLGLYFSESFYELFEKLYNSTFVNQGNLNNILITFMRQLDFSDCCQLMFINEYLELKVLSSINKSLLFVFDNLDRLNIETIASGFTQKFKNIYNRINTICNIYDFNNKKVDFKRSTGVMFVLRDANFAVLNPHFKRRIDIGEIELDSLTEANLIVDKRIDFFKKRHPNLNSQNLSIFEKVFRDKYLIKYFQPLFNFDYRKLVSSLFKIIEEDMRRKSSLKLDNFTILHKKGYPYGARGILYLGFIEQLWEEDFLRQYGLVPDDKLNQKVDGLCNPHRVILTLIMNLTNFKMAYKTLLNSNIISKYIFSYTPIPLSIILDECRKLFDVNVIIDIIKRYFFSSNNDWCNVITIHYPIQKTSILFDENSTNNYDLKYILDKYKELYKKNNETFDIDESGKRDLELLKINLNPAGFVYLNNIIVHYEFYSHLCKHQKPLFNDILFNFGQNKLQYYFESNINEVLQLVKQHIILMNRFFEKKYIPNGISASEFANSNLSYKVTKYDREFEDKDQKLQFRNEFHSTRLITHHISYIDEFRIYILNDEEFISYNTNYILKREDLAKNNSLLEINKLIIKFISEYLDLLETSFDTSVRERIIDPLRGKIKLIKASEYNDFRTRINMYYNNYFSNE